MRLIDADALKKKLCDHNCDEAENPCEHFIKGRCFMEQDFDFIHDVIDNAPTVDPVKHGHWVDDNPASMFQIRKCSVCKAHVTLNFNYCPNCGAKMDENPDGFSCDWFMKLDCRCTGTKEMDYVGCGGDLSCCELKPPREIATDIKVGYKT